VVYAFPFPAVASVSKFSFTANGRAEVNRTTDGFMKILANAATKRMLCARIIRPEA
jgi:dihydrolipoamide dehydrogenase